MLSCKAKVLCHVWTAGLCQGFALLERQLNILHQNHLQTKGVFINTDNSAFLGGESNFQNLIEKMRLEKGKKKKEKKNNPMKRLIFGFDRKWWILQKAATTVFVVSPNKLLLLSSIQRQLWGQGVALVHDEPYYPRFIICLLKVPQGCPRGRGCLEITHRFISALAY